jgi:hypothetical protein
MKAVRQIIDYLCKEGVLGKEDLAALAGGGFVGWHEVYQDEPGSEATIDDAGGGADPSTSLPASAREEDAVALTPKRPARAKRARNVVRKGPLLDEKGLLSRLRQAFESWPVTLSGLVRLARRLEPNDPCQDWPQAAVLIRKAKPAKLTDTIQNALERREISFDVLWSAVACEPYRDVIRETGIHGPAVSGFRAILTSKDRAHLGRHVKLLRHREVADVYNLRLAQRKALAAMEPILERRSCCFTRPSAARAGTAHRHDPANIIRPADCRPTTSGFEAGRGPPFSIPKRSRHSSSSFTK